MEELVGGQMPSDKQIGWREPAIILSILGLVVAAAAFGRDLVNFTFSDGTVVTSASSAATTSPVAEPTKTTVGPITTPTQDGYELLMPTGPNFTSGVAVTATDGIDIDVDPPQSPTLSGGDAEFHTTKTQAFVTGAKVGGVYQWDEAGAPTEDQCSGGLDAAGEKSASVDYKDMTAGIWAFCILTSDGRNAYVVLSEKAYSPENATSQVSVFVW